ncbi:MAG TPA: VOC family protein [Acidimicrobiia bacterium]|nr:VOC family protein [Acidimicrobiia bacterium]
MEPRGIVWAGTRTTAYAAMTTFAGDTLGLRVVEETDGMTVYELADGDRFEVFDATGAEGASYFDAPVVGFLVDDVAAAAAELEAAGVELLGPVADVGESAWAHFRAPDGHVYELAAGDRFRTR